MFIDTTCPKCSTINRIEYKSTAGTIRCARCHGEYSYKIEVPDIPANVCVTWKAKLRMTMVLGVNIPIAIVAFSIASSLGRPDIAQKLMTGIISAAIGACGLVYYYDIHRQTREKFPELYEGGKIPSPPDDPLRP